MFFKRRTELLLFGPGPWEAVIGDPTTGGSAWDISPKPKEQEKDLGLAQPCSVSVSGGSKNLDVFPHSV